MFIDEKGAVLKIGEQSIALPLITDENGKKSVDIRRLRKDSGIITYDPGFGNTASCMSSICTVDGEKGILKYRGYDIEDLVDHCDFVEVAHLLVKGELPNVEQRKNYMELLNRHSLLHNDMQDFFRSYPPGAHPMAILAAMVASLSAFYPEMENADPEENIDLTVTRLLSKMRTIAAFTYRKELGMDFVNPSYKYSYCENFLNMMFSSPVVDYKPDPVHIAALNKLLIIHADHEQNCSTTAVRLVGSSEANLYASVTAGISALWGSRHGGANQAVIQTLEYMIHNNVNPDQMIERAKSKDNSFRLPGFGHRIYKTYDPRAKIAKKLCRDVIDTTHGSSQLLDIALELEAKVLKDDFFLERNLYPNVDFYTGITYHLMGIPTNMFTVMFAVGRVPGWIAHYLEWKHDPYEMLARPRQVYTGPVARKVIPIGER
ncbi:MAG: citrate synthase [Sphaerochaetaceae bacterium]|jgi:citrate synthase|nr:citrate synthase [Sphaerochaetaceae bacterium]MDD4007959.1 citrate synthase [Sphaerochaetaceae bacterium]